jgi:hypothetical protein
MTISQGILLRGHEVFVLLEGEVGVRVGFVRAVDLLL